MLNSLNMNRKKNLVIGSSGILVLLIVAGAGFWFYQSRSKPYKEALPAIVRQAVALNEAVKQTSIDIYHASEKLDSIRTVPSGIADIKAILEILGEIRQLEKENQKDIQKLIQFTKDHHTFFRRKNLSWISSIREFYASPHVLRHRKSRAIYFSAFESLLEYMAENFENITRLKSLTHLKNYDAYYLKYRKAADSYDQFNKKRIAFQKEFINAHPEVRAFLPDALHMEPFKFWDRFSF